MAERYAGTGAASTRRTLLVDARCLQRPGYATRGIGLHAATMLNAAPRHRFRLDAFLDPALPAPSPAHLALFERVTTTGYAASRAGAILLTLSPMTEAPLPLARLRRSPRCRSVAVVFDFIPLDFPERYLVAASSRRRYAACLAALRRHDRFLPISAATRTRFETLFPGHAGRSSVTGVAIRAALLPLAPPRPAGARSGALVVAGDDWRKNPETAVRAAARAGVTLTVVGVHDPRARAALAALHDGEGGRPDALIFAPRLDDAALAALYAAARVLVAPSRAEGFSLPLVEAMAQGTPVLAAEEPAQADLIRDPADRFDPDDVGGLAAMLARITTDDAAFAAAGARQAGIWQAYRPDAVAARFWAPIEGLVEEMESAPAAPAILGGARPRIGLLSPLPPTPSGCADHSAALLAAMAPLAEVTAFSATRLPSLPAGVAFGGRADPTVMTGGRFDALVAVLGNSPLHRDEMHCLLDFGAAAILHDARLLDFYRAGLGDRRAAIVAALELGRAASAEELAAWRLDQSVMPVRCLGEVAAAAAPLIVHARETAQFVAARHGVDPVFLPFAPYRRLDPALLTDGGRAAARARLGIAPGEVLIASFGHVHRDKCPGRLIEAVAALGRRDGLRLAFAGSGDPVVLEALRTRAASLGLPAGAVRLSESQLPERAYADHLAAADIAVQLRRAPPGSISGALMDAIVAGLPAVASRTLVEALEPPASVVAVADDAPAEAVAAAIDRALTLDRAAARAASETVLRARGMDRYAARLVEAVLR